MQRFDWFRKSAANLTDEALAPGLPFDYEKEKEVLAYDYAFGGDILAKYGEEMYHVVGLENRRILSVHQREMDELAEEHGFFSNHKINDRNIYVSFRVYVQIKTHSPACLLDRLRDVIEKHPTPSPSFLLPVSVLQFIDLFIILQNSVTL